MIILQIIEYSNNKYIYIYTETVLDLPRGD